MRYLGRREAWCPSPSFTDSLSLNPSQSLKSPGVSERIRMVLQMWAVTPLLVHQLACTAHTTDALYSMGGFRAPNSHGSGLHGLPLVTVTSGGVRGVTADSCQPRDRAPADPTEADPRPRLMTPETRIAG